MQHKKNMTYSTILIKNGKHILMNFTKTKDINKTVLLILLGILVISCDFKKKIPTKISKEFLSGKEFIADPKVIMGSKHFVFIDTNKVYYFIKDKTAYGYDGTYSFEYDDNGNQFIKIVEEKGNLKVVLFVKSTTELEIEKVEPEVYKATTFPFFDIKHQIGKIYELKIIETEQK